MRYSFFDVSFMYYLLILLSTHLPYVLGHGYVHNVVVGGQTYAGWNPFSDPYNPSPPKIVRKIRDDGFVASTDVDIACHHYGNEGTSAIANAPAGSKITFNWSYWPGDHQGPVSTYMTPCNGGCSNFSANSARWFKIDAEGYDSSSKKWASEKLISNGASWTSTIPARLLAGEYLIRNEIAALHSVTPQFYPSCSQIKVTGSGTGLPSDDDMVSMQLVYKNLTSFNIWNDDASAFTIAGPPPVNLDGNGGKSTTQTSRTLPSPTPVAVASEPSMQCQLRSKLRRRITG